MAPVLLGIGNGWSPAVERLMPADLGSDFFRAQAFIHARLELSGLWLKMDALGNGTILNHRFTGFILAS